MSTAFDHSGGDNPFDASYEEYMRTVGAEDVAPAAPIPFGARGSQDVDELDDDPEVTQASAETADFSSPGVGDGVEAPWSNLAETTEGDPFASPGKDQD